MKNKLLDQLAAKQGTTREYPELPRIAVAKPTKKHQKETGSIFLICNEEGKIRTSDNNGKDRRSEEQRKAEREDLGWHKRMVVIRAA